MRKELQTRSSTLNSRDAALRRDLFWIAMTTGTALVALQFACARPESVPATTEARSVDRLPLPQQGTLKAVLPDTATPGSWWVQPKRPAAAEATTTPPRAKPKASGRASAALHGE